MPEINFFLINSKTSILSLYLENVKSRSKCMVFFKMRWLIETLKTQITNQELFE